MVSTPSLERQWARQWTEAAVALADVRARELRALTDADALAAADDLLNIAKPGDMPESRRAWSGLVELERLLHRRRP